MRHHIKKKGVHYNLFVVVVNSNSEFKVLLGLRVVAGQTITWKKRKTQERLQFFNCQKYDHVAMNCAAPHRCVKGGHGPGECPRNKNDAEEGTQLPPPYCVSCKTEGDAASYRECQVYQKLKKARLDKSRGPKNTKSHDHECEIACGS